jgi:FlaA1/EpsC-like NDP-sugar epimerase
LILDNNESGLYNLTTILHQHLSAIGAETGYKSEILVPLVADIRDEAKIYHMLNTYHPQLVFHVAAYKHVPLMEEQPEQAVRVNVLGTRIMAKLAARCAVERFVMISTDKAIKPISVMGATKRAGELIVTQVSHTPSNRTKNSDSATLFTVVRFGNVLGSRGSVIDTFNRQIELGGPVTITHPEMKRYFMSINEAVSLTIHAATFTHGDDLFMLDMGQEIRIVDLAHKMIRLRGLRPDKDIPIEYIGIRPGEKLREDLLAAYEERLPTLHPKILRIRSHLQVDGHSINRQIDKLIELANGQHQDEMTKLLWEIVRAETSSKPVSAITEA